MGVNGNELHKRARHNQEEHADGTSGLYRLL